MSYMTVKALWPGEKARELAEFRNAWGGAPIIWDALNNKYFPSNSWIHHANDEVFWNLYKDPKIPESYRAILLMTYDGAWIAKTDYARASKDIKEFFKNFSVNPEHANHWAKIMDILDSNPDCPAIGFYWTSVGDDMFAGEVNEENGEVGPVNWDNTFDVYKELDAIRTKDTNEDQTQSNTTN